MLFFFFFLKNRDCTSEIIIKEEKQRQEDFYERIGRKGFRRGNRGRDRSKDVG